MRTSNIFRIICGIVFLILFFFVKLFYVQLIMLALAVLVLPLSIVTVLPVALIYDTVFSGDRVPIFTIAGLAFILLSLILRPYIRRS